MRVLPRRGYRPCHPRDEAQQGEAHEHAQRAAMRQGGDAQELGPHDGHARGQGQERERQDGDLSRHKLRPGEQARD